MREVAATTHCVVLFNALLLGASLVLLSARPALRGDGGSGSGGAGGESGRATLAALFEQPRPVDLNTATLRELAGLPGIGMTRARRILEDRDARGRYATLADLDRVPGIGPGTINRLRGVARAALDDE